MGGHGGLNILPQKRWNGEYKSQGFVAGALVHAFTDISVLDLLQFGGH